MLRWVGIREWDGVQAGALLGIWGIVFSWLGMKSTLKEMFTDCM
jgi:hypothetical protein